MKLVLPLVYNWEKKLAIWLDEWTENNLEVQKD